MGIFYMDNYAVLKQKPFYFFNFLQTPITHIFYVLISSHRSPRPCLALLFSPFLSVWIISEDPILSSVMLTLIIFILWVSSSSKVCIQVWYFLVLQLLFYLFILCCCVIVEIHHCSFISALIFFFYYLWTFF